MSSPRAARPNLVTARQIDRIDWRGYRHALLRSLYALLLTLLLLLPANFIAYAISLSTNGGSALQGLAYALAHHLMGYYVMSSAGVLVIGAAEWWAAVVWECLFWLSCLSALLLFSLWIVRALLARLVPHLRGRRVLLPVRV